MHGRGTLASCFGSYTLLIHWVRGRVNPRTGLDATLPLVRTELRFYCHPACSIFTILSSYTVFSLHVITNMFLLNLKLCRMRRVSCGWITFAYVLLGLLRLYSLCYRSISLLRASRQVWITRNDTVFLLLGFPWSRASWRGWRGAGPRVQPVDGGRLQTDNSDRDTATLAAGHFGCYFNPLA
jgi:hypothetical protein